MFSFRTPNVQRGAPRQLTQISNLATNSLPQQVEHNAAMGTIPSGNAILVRYSVLGDILTTHSAAAFRPRNVAYFLMRFWWTTARKIFINIYFWQKPAASLLQAAIGRQSPRAHFNALEARPVSVGSQASQRFSQPLAFSHCVLLPLKQEEERAEPVDGNTRAPKATGRGNTRTNCGARTATAAKDKTALEIAANEALFGGGDASSMGNYDRDSHLRMQLPSHRVKAAAPPSNTSGNNPNTGPYFHHFLERSSSANSSANSLLFAPSNSYADAAPPNTSGKRPRPGNINSISNSNSNNNGNFLGAFGGYPSPPPFDADHPLPDFITNWGFTSRAGAKGNSATSTAPIVGGSSATTTSSHSSSHVTTSSSLSGIGSPNAASMFASVDSFLPDYDSSLYSLWNAPGGYDTENDAAQGQQQQEQVQPPLYMASEDELKMDYPQLPEFNQDLDSYLNDTMDSGGPSPTTPLGTSTGHNSSGMMKMDHLVTTDRRTGGSNLTMGTQLERLLAPAAPTATLTSTAMATATPGYLKRDRGEESTSGRSVKRSRGAFDDAYATDAPASSGAVTGTSANDNASSFKTTMIEPKRALMPSLGSFHTGTSFLMPTPAVSSQVEAPSPSTAVISTTTIVTPTSAASDTAGTKGSKRPRSRQCEFPGCQNRARSHQKCKKHGGAHQCVFEGCTKNSQSRGLCIAHGGGSRCTHEGCVRAAQSKGLCKSHGGGEYCAVEGCRKKAHLKHLCRTHGGGVRCKVEKCLKWAQRKGWCMAHAKEFSAT